MFKTFWISKFGHLNLFRISNFVLRVYRTITVRFRGCRGTATVKVIVVVIALMIGAAFFVFGSDGAFFDAAREALGDTFGFNEKTKPIYEIDLGGKSADFVAGRDFAGFSDGEGDMAVAADGPVTELPTAPVKISPQKKEPKILISEIFYDAEGGDGGKEFVELYNSSDFDGNIAGWSIKNNGATLVEIGSKSGDGKTVKAGGYFLVGLNSWSGPPIADAARSAALPNSTTTVTLYNADGEVADSVTYPASCIGCLFQSGQSYGRVSWDGGEFVPQESSPTNNQ